MELDNIIYIAIIVTIFVISILGQLIKKKAPSAPVAKDETLYTLNDFEKILERKEEYRKNEEQIVKNDEEIANKEEKKIQAVDEPQDSTKQKAKKDEIDDGFDVKSAIIYSSILERKKFRN